VGCSFYKIPSYISQDWANTLHNYYYFLSHEAKPAPELSQSTWATRDNQNFQKS
jgi:hypothetical protein